MIQHKTASILLVEDDPVTFRALQRALEKQGYNCLGARSLEEALQISKKESLDLVLSDVRLPDGTGLELLKTMRNYLLDIPFVVITSSEKKSLIQDAIRLGANDFLTKPFNLQNLPTIIERNLIRQKLDSVQDKQKRVSILTKTIHALIAALEAKDSYTSGHSVRVARYARLIGEALKLSENELFTLELSSLLHDIGKIGMPDSILNKTSSLEKREYQLAREHPVVGSNIVGKIDDLREVAAIIRHHHERYDGSGYPDGLAGEAIPLLSRIITLTDSYESIISTRSYRVQQDKLYALDELQKHSGTQFDPELTTLFSQVMKSAQGYRKPKLEIENSD